MISQFYSEKQIHLDRIAFLNLSISAFHTFESQLPHLIYSFPINSMTFSVDVRFSLKNGINCEFKCLLSLNGSCRLLMTEIKGFGCVIGCNTSTSDHHDAAHLIQTLTPDVTLTPTYF